MQSVCMGPGDCCDSANSLRQLQCYYGVPVVREGFKKRQEFCFIKSITDNNNNDGENSRTANTNEYTTNY
jgi:hypothetical protein